MKRLHTDIPSRTDVEVALQALEIEDEREKEAIRKFYERERKPIQITWKTLLVVGILIAIGVGSLLCLASYYLSAVNW
jgi:hypothetical protein